MHIIPNHNLTKLYLTLPIVINLNVGLMSIFYDYELCD